ncbi:MAG: 50S ribosomal protein L17 [Bacteroidota bacterium]
MNHLKAGRTLNRTASHRRALLCNMASSLFEHKKITTTEAKAKELRGFAEDLISKAKRGIMRERQGLIADGHKLDVHSRRMVGRDIASKAVVQELFDTIAPAVMDRPGGYTRIIKIGQRRGDGSPEAIIELVDWSAPQDGATTKRKKQAKKTAPKVKASSKKEESNKQLAQNSGTTEANVDPDIAASATASVEENTPAENNVEMNAETNPEVNTASEGTENNTSDAGDEQNSNDQDSKEKA